MVEIAERISINIVMNDESYCIAYDIAKLRKWNNSLRVCVCRSHTIDQHRRGLQEWKGSGR
jgi:hypothetical protein